MLERLPFIILFYAQVKSLLFLSNYLILPIIMPQCACTSEVYGSMHFMCLCVSVSCKVLHLRGDLTSLGPMQALLFLFFVTFKIKYCINWRNKERNRGKVRAWDANLAGHTIICMVTIARFSCRVLEFPNNDISRVLHTKDVWRGLQSSTIAKN